MNKTNIALFCFVVIIAFFLRFFNLGAVPFVSDEFLDVNATYGHHKTGSWQAWDFNHSTPSVRQNKASDERAWIYRTQISYLYNFLEPTEKNIRLVSVLWGVFTVIVLYIITFVFTKNYWISFFASFLFALSPEAIELNRKIRMYSMFVPIFLLFSMSLYYFLQTGTQKSKKLLIQIFNFNYIFLIPTILLGVLSFHLHPLTVNIFIVVFVFFITKMLKEFKNNNFINKYLVYNIAIVLSIIFSAIFLKDYFKNTIEFFGNHWNYIGHILSNYWHPLFGALFIIIGFYIILHKKRMSDKYLWIGANFFAILFAAILLWNRNVGKQYIFFAQTFGFIITSIGIYGFIEFLSNKFNSKKQVFVLGILAFIIFLPNYAYFFKKDNTYHITSKGDQPNYRNLFLYVKKNKKEGDVMITRNFRNYYFSDLDIQVFDFGSEREEEKLKKENKVKKITKEYAQKIIKDNPSGWIIYSDNDKKFIEKEARKYFKDNLEEIDNSPLVRGKIKVFKWNKKIK